MFFPQFIYGVNMESKNILIKDATIIADEIKKSSLLIQNDKIVEISDRIDSNDADRCNKCSKAKF